MKEIVTSEVKSAERFDQVLNVWIEKPQTILKCVTCAVLPGYLNDYFHFYRF